MISRADLTRLAKSVATDLSEGYVSPSLPDIGEALASAPDSILDVLDLMAKEAGKKKPNSALIDAYGLMLGQALEILRYLVERNIAAAVKAAASVRTRVGLLAQEGKLDPGTLFLILRQFTGAKLDLGDDLRDLMVDQVNHPSVSALPSKEDVDAMLADMAMICDGDSFALQAELAEEMATFPEGYRGVIVNALVQARDSILREASIGWLLDSGPTTRRDTVNLLQQAADAGHISGTMLRRMIAIRNWLPDEERPAVDAVIRTCRQKGIECTPLKASQVGQVVASAIDGSGAQNLFVILKEGRKQAAAALLLKQDVGVREAWVNHGLTKADINNLLFQLDSQVECYEIRLDYVRLALGHTLAAARLSGMLPPFGLVDVIERIGLGAVNPESVPIDSLLSELLSAIPADRKNDRAVAEILEYSASWEHNFLFVASWFEDDGAIDALLAGKRLSAGRRVALVLDKYLPDCRARWAERLVWTALALRQHNPIEDDWMQFALVARELRGERPLADIPLMTAIAEKTVESWAARSVRPF